MIRRVLGAALFVLAGASIYMSWGALYEFARAAGMPPERAVVFPVVIDVVTVVSMLIAVLVPARSKLVAVYPWIAMTIFGAATIGGNALHVTIVAPEDVQVDMWIAVVANSLPAIALLVTTHLAAVTVFHRPAVSETVLEEVEVETDTAATVLTAVPALLPSNPELPSENKRAAVEKLAAEGHSLRQIAQVTGVPRSTVARWSRDVTPTSSTV